MLWAAPRRRGCAHTRDVCIPIQLHAHLRLRLHLPLLLLLLPRPRPRLRRWNRSSGPASPRPSCPCPTRCRRSRALGSTRPWAPRGAAATAPSGPHRLTPSSDQKILDHRVHGCFAPAPSNNGSGYHIFGVRVRGMQILRCELGSAPWERPPLFFGVSASDIAQRFPHTFRPSLFHRFHRSSKWVFALSVLRLLIVSGLVPSGLPRPADGGVQGRWAPSSPTAIGSPACLACPACPAWRGRSRAPCNLSPTHDFQCPQTSQLVNKYEVGGREREREMRGVK